MIYFTQEAKEKLDKLFYYPYTFGKHLEKANKDLRIIETSIPHLPLRLGTHNVSLRGIGSFTYVCNGRDIFLQFISWSTVLTKFYYRKSNFIIFTSKGNIPSTHPSLYIDRTESYFQCDNGFKVVSRKYESKNVFNFKDLSGNIICDIDFLQVKPFDRFKDMTARGYTPDRRCYMVFEDGYKEEVNENIRNDYDSIIGETSVSKIANDETIYTTQFKGRFVDSELEKPNIYKDNKQYKIMNNTKKRIRLTESQLHNVIKRCVNEALNELSPEVAARYEGGRQAQADNAINSQEKFKYQQKANSGREYAQNAWNNKYGFDFNNGAHDWGYQKMRGGQGFAHNGDAKYGIDYQGERSNWEENGYTHTNMAYNPKTNTVWQGDGRGNSSVQQHKFDIGDNGAYRTANQMEKGSQEVYNKYRNRELEECIRRTINKVLR